jgi:hypothetical protein
MISNKYCICFSGQLREPEKLLPALAVATKGIDATFVFSVWAHAGSKVDGAMNIHQLPRVFESEAMGCLPFDWYGSSNLWPALPNLQQEIISQKQDLTQQTTSDLINSHFPDALIDIEDEALLDLDFPTRKDDSHSIRMLYKIWRANAISNRLVQKGNDFKIVIRLRPDLLFNNINFNSIEKRVLAGEFLVDSWRPGCCGDLFAAGTPPQMSIYASTFGRSLSRPLIWRHVHEELAETLKIGGINPTVLGAVMIAPNTNAKVSTLTLANNINKSLSASSDSPLHRVVLSAARAAVLLEKNESEAALHVLLQVIDEPILLVATKANGWLYILAKYFEREGAYDIAVLVALAIYKVDLFFNYPPGREVASLILKKVYVLQEEGGIGVQLNSKLIFEKIQIIPKLEKILETHLEMDVQTYTKKLHLTKSIFFLQIIQNSVNDEVKVKTLVQSFLLSNQMRELSSEQTAWLFNFVRSNSSKDVYFDLFKKMYRMRTQVISEDWLEVDIPLKKWNSVHGGRLAYCEHEGMVFFDTNTLDFHLIRYESDLFFGSIIRLEIIAQPRPQCDTALHVQHWGGYNVCTFEFKDIKPIKQSDHLIDMHCENIGNNFIKYSCVFFNFHTTLSFGTGKPNGHYHGSGRDQYLITSIKVFKEKNVLT